MISYLKRHLLTEIFKKKYLGPGIRTRAFSAHSPSLYHMSQPGDKKLRPIPGEFLPLGLSCSNLFRWVHSPLSILLSILSCIALTLDDCVHSPALQYQYKFYSYPNYILKIKVFVRQTAKFSLYRLEVSRLKFFQLSKFIATYYLTTCS